MANRVRRSVAALIGAEVVPPDTRPIGVFFNCDPSSAVFAQHINRFDPLSPKSREPVDSHMAMFDKASGSIKTTDRRTLRMHDPMWVKRHPEGEE